MFTTGLVVFVIVSAGIVNPLPFYSNVSQHFLTTYSCRNNNIIIATAANASQ